MNTDEHPGFTAHHIRFEVEALTPLLLPTNAGPSIRGALFGALRHHFCPVPGSQTPDAAHKAICPVCWLMAAEKPERERGRDVPRPYTVEPPISLYGNDGKATWFEAGERFCFGLTLYAQAMNLFPYIVLAVPIMGQSGMGVPLRENGRREGEKRRGQFKLCRIEAVNPLTGEVTPVMGEGRTTVNVPDVPATGGDVSLLGRAMLGRIEQGGQLRIVYKTPMRLVDGERLVKQPYLGPLVRRLLERLDALRGEYAGVPPVAEREELSALADGVRLAEDRTRWVEVKSRSRRLERHTWVSGFVGTATYEADLQAWKRLLPYLLWGQVVHVGKNATKGNGWYEVRMASGE